MPKISKKTIRAGSRSTAEETFEVEVNYNQEELFYIKIPEKFNAVVDALESDQLKKYHAYKHDVSPRGRSLSAAKSYHRAVNAPSEKEVVDRMQKFLTYLMAESVTVRKVILVYFMERVTTYSGRAHNTEHPEIGMQYGLCYGTETKVGKQGKPFYHDEKGIRNDGLWNENGHVVIDDTPENRLFVESIYTALGALIAKLELHTNSPKALLELINSKQKLLS